MDLTTEQEFWNWFREREDLLYSSDMESEDLFEEVSERISFVHEDLGFEMTLEPDLDGKREFVVSAGGLLGAFESVKRLVASAPQLDRWKVVGFRPRKQVGGYVRIDDHQIALNTIRVGLRPFGAHIGVTIYFPDFIESEASVFGDAAFLLLDMVLGEFDVLAKIGPVEMSALDKDAAGDIFSLAELPAEFDSVSESVQASLARRTIMSREEVVAELRVLHRPTIELLEEVVAGQIALDAGSPAEDMTRKKESYPLEPESHEDEAQAQCLLHLRFFSYTQFEAEALVDQAFASLDDAECNIFQAPSLRGEGWVITIEFAYEENKNGSVRELFSKLLEMGASCKSELDIIQFQYEELETLLETLPKVHASYLYHRGQAERAYAVIRDAELEHADDFEYWAISAYICASLGRDEEFQSSLERFKELMADEDEESPPLGSLWQMACACALTGEAEEACYLIGLIIDDGNSDTVNELIAELNEHSDLLLIRSTEPFRALLDRFGIYH
jgi:hypothetical protein